MEATIVRYQVTAESADENERLVQAVYDELAATDPGNLQYATFRMADGVTFVHIAIVDPAGNPLFASPAFAQFQAGLGERCVVPPNPTGATLVGQYRLNYGAAPALAKPA